MTTARAPYFINGPVDVFFIGGLSLLIYLLASLPGLPEDMGLRASALAAYVSWIVNWPHFSATSWRLYRTPQSRAQFPVTTWLLPLVILGFVAAALLRPDNLAPWWIKLFLLWSPYHFSAQSLGITLLYARRLDFPLDGLARRALWIFIFGTFLFPSLHGETGALGSYYGIPIPSLGLPPALALAMQTVMLAAGASAFLLLIRTAWQKHRRLPLMLLLPGATQYVWFIAGSDVPGFLEFVPAFHSLQYLFIAWFMQLREKMEENHTPPSPAYALKETVRWGSANILGGALLFAALPGLAASATGLDLLVATGIVIAGAQIHHFFVDGVIWKLRNPRVSTPLLTSLRDLTRKAAT